MQSKTILLPLTYDHSNELIILVDEIIKNNEWIYKKELEDFRENNANAKERLIDHLIVAALNDKYCHPGVDTNIPDWLRAFIFDCYAAGHNQLANKYAANQ